MAAAIFDMVITKARPSRHAQWHLLAILLIAVTATNVYANQVPVADAGPSRYAGDEPSVLDGTGSYDPDPGDTLSYQWTQLSGPAVVLSDTDTATPIMTATLTGDVEIVELELTVTDASLASSSDTVQVTIVPSMPPAEYPLILENSDFDRNKPTFVYFGGGDCTTGGGTWGSAVWYTKANVIRTSGYMVDSCVSMDDCRFVTPKEFYRYGNALIVFLSSLAPEYDQPIETAGYSTGGMPAVDVAIQMNSFADARYNVTRVSLLDGGCDLNYPYQTRIENFSSNPVACEPAWVISYYAPEDIYGRYRSGAFNVRMPGLHGTPRNWVRSSIVDTFYPYPDIYNHGVVAGAFLSVVGPGKNYNVPPDTISSYYFYWDSDGVRYMDQIKYPGALPEPVTLIGPSDGAVASPTGVTLSCETSENAIVYQLLWGQDKQNLQVVYEQDEPLSISTGPLPPGQAFYWTIKVRDQYGTTIHADPRMLTAPEGLLGDFNGDGQLDSDDCAIIQLAMNITWGDESFALAANLNGDGLVTCLDTEMWLDLYRAFLQDPSAPDPCGLEDPTDTDGDGVRDLCDNCPTANTDQTDTDSDGLGDVCDNCPSQANADQEDVDGDSWGDVCDNCPTDPNKADPGQCGCGALDTDSDGDGTADCNDNCPTDPNKTDPGQCGCGTPDTDTDGDGMADCNDNCPTDPNKTDPGQCGCGALDTDTDGDGALDCNESCPNDPNKIEPGQCGCGVADIDTDGDGALDCDESCPNDPNKTEPGICGCGVPEGEGCAPAVTSAVSIKTHLRVGDFAIDVLDRTGGQDIECRKDGVTKLVVGFDIDIQGIGGLDLTDVSLTSGTVKAVNLNAGNELTIEMSGTTNAVPLTLTFPGIANASDPSGICTDSVCIRQLFGDVRPDGVINCFDRLDVRNETVIGIVSRNNFRADVRADGRINAEDRVDVRDAMGTGFVGSCP